MTIPELKWQDFPHEIPEGTRIRVTDRTNQIYVSKNGRWELEITWTKCSDRLPPRTDKEKVILRGHPDKNLMYMTSDDCNLLLPNYSKLREYCEWKPYTEEAWELLNRKTD